MDKYVLIILNNKDKNNISFLNKIIIKRNEYWPIAYTKECQIHNMTIMIILAC